MTLAVAQAQLEKVQAAIDKALEAQSYSIAGRQKVMADLAMHEPAAFTALVEKARAALA